MVAVDRLWDWEGKVEPWMRRHGRVRDERGRAMKFVPEPVQELGLEEVRAFHGVPRVWSGVVKPRQVGFTTLWMEIVSALCITHPGTSVLVVTPSEDKYGPEILHKWRTIQTELKMGGGGHPGSRNDNSNEYIFANGSRVTWHHIGGEADVAESVGRAGTFQLAVFTELAFAIDALAAAAAFAAMRPAIERAGAAVLIDSTPNGVTGPGATYYRLIMQIQRGELDGDVHFWPWWLDPMKSRDVSGVNPRAFAAGLTREERRLVRAHKVTFGQIMWRREMMVSPSMTKTEARRRFLQEYPESLRGCFRRPSSTLFDGELMAALQERREEKRWEPPLDVGEVRALLRLAGVEVGGSLSDLLLETRWLQDDPGEGYCRFWQIPEHVADRSVGEGAAARGPRPAPGARELPQGMAARRVMDELLSRERCEYFGGVDCSDGQPGSDWQALHGVDLEGGMVVSLRSRVDRMIFAACCQRIAMVYGMSLRIEHAGGGELVAEWIRQAVTPDQARRRGVPWGLVRVLATPWPHMRLVRTSKKNRPEIIDGGFTTFTLSDVRDPETLEEMEGLIRNKQGKIVAGSGGFDDQLLARGLAEVHRQALGAGSEEEDEQRRRLVQRALRRGLRSRGRHDYLS